MSDTPGGLTDPQLPGRDGEPLGAYGGPNGRLRQPPGIYLLFVTEMWERFSYYGMRGLLVLYLISVLTPHQLKPGVYSNEVEIVEASRAADPQRPETAPVQRIPFHVAVATPGFQPAPFVAAESPAAPALRIQRAKVVEPATGNGEPEWVVDAGAPLGPVVVAGPARGKGKFTNAESEYVISNPTSETIEAKITVRRPEARSPTYFTVNRSVSTVTAKIKPDSELKAGEKPFRLTVAANTHDSGRNWTQGSANLLYGWYTGLAYLLPIVGGFIADRLNGTYRSMLLGGTIIALGHIVLAISGFGELAMNALGMSTFIGGLALVIIGTGFFKPTVTVMVGQLYKPGDPRRDGGFSIFYMGVNTGAFICAFVCGTLGEKVGWHWGFGSAAVGMIAGLIVFMMGKPKLLPGIGLPPAGKPNYFVPLLLASMAVAAAVGLIYHQGGFAAVGRWIQWLKQPENSTLLKVIVYGLLTAVIAAAAWFVSIQKPGEKGPVACIFTFIFFNAFFWIAFEQAGSTLNVFAQDATNRKVFGLEIPATWFQSVNAGLIILLAPLFVQIWTGLGARGRNPSQPIKISLGLFFLGVGYIFIVIGAMRSAGGALVSPFWLLAMYFFHTVGELCLSPTGLSFVTKTAPVRFVSLLMGIWYLSNFVANLGGGLIASQVEKIEKGEITLPWQQWLKLGGRADFFMLFLITSMVGALVIFLLSPFLKRLLHGKG